MNQNKLNKVMLRVSSNKHKCNLSDRMLTNNINLRVSHRCHICGVKCKCVSDRMLDKWIKKKLCSGCLIVVRAEVSEMNEKGIDIDVVEHILNKILMEQLTR